MTKEYISGLVERVTYHNSENGFCVIRVKVKNNRDLVTITGNSPTISPGEYIKASGSWQNDKNHGLQFRADFLKSLPPDTLEGIEKYLGSGLIRGIGKHFAKKLVSAFRERVFEVIELKPELLSSIEGIGRTRAKSICENWQEQKIVREIMIFLQSHGVGTLRATRIYKTYGDESIEIVSENPYRLAKDIRGIGFISADTIAKNLGIAKDSMIRARAGISYALLEATSDGHCGLPKEMLVSEAQKLLEIDKKIIEAALEAEALEEGVIIDDLDLEESQSECVFLKSYYIYEQQIAYMLKQFKKGKLPCGDIDLAKAIDWVEERVKIKLANSQKEAVRKAFMSKIIVITGGPGTGKTTLVNSIIKIMSVKGVKIKLCAPTGRAAKRLSESTGMEALTIHRLLGIDPRTGKFKYNNDNKLICDYLILDEASMVDVALFSSLLKGVPFSAGILIVGDVDQLPSVGAGQVLLDIIKSGRIETVRLTEIFRQSMDSDIILNAHLVNRGIVPNMNRKANEDRSSSERYYSPKSDFYFIEAEPGDDISEKLIKLVKQRIPKKFKLNPVNDVQILTPMQRGGSGARSINIQMQEALNPNLKQAISQYGQNFAPFDKIMQLENNYDKEVYNGDIGKIISIDRDEQEVEIRFEDRNVKYAYNELDQITLAYATTIHKSQGSEYPAVIIPLTMQSFMMLQRNLIYTAITRGKELVIILGEKRALAMAVKKSNAATRYTKLKSWLMIE